MHTIQSRRKCPAHSTETTTTCASRAIVLVTELWVSEIAYNFCKESVAGDDHADETW